MKFTVNQRTLPEDVVISFTNALKAAGVVVSCEFGHDEVILSVSNAKAAELENVLKQIAVITSCPLTLKLAQEILNS